MNIPVKYILLLAGAAFFYASCSLKERDKDTVVKVTPEFTVQMLEKDSDPDSFRLVVQTIENQPCINNTIRFGASRVGTKLFLSLYEILQAEDCVEGDEPVKATAEFGHLANGFYLVQLDLKNTVKNTGSLRVADDGYLLQFDDANGFEVVNQELKRVPNHVVWGYVGYNDADLAGAEAQDFLTELEGKTLPKLMSSGPYSEFSIDVDQKLILKSPPSLTYFKTFFAEAEGGGLDSLQALIDGYRTGPSGSLLTISLNTWDGRSL